MRKSITKAITLDQETEELAHKLRIQLDDQNLSQVIRDAINVLYLLAKHQYKTYNPHIEKIQFKYGGVREQ